MVAQSERIWVNDWKVKSSNSSSVKLSLCFWVFEQDWNRSHASCVTCKLIRMKASAKSKLIRSVPVSGRVLYHKIPLLKFKKKRKNEAELNGWDGRKP